MSLNFTVAVPTYNGAERLPLVLERLRSQVQTESVTWEVIIVDNNSTDQTAAVVRQFQADWPDHTPLKYCLETRQGSAYARQRAIKEAQGEFVGFLDDDNLPAANWVAEAVQFARARPKAGAFGGQILGNFEVQPSREFKQVKSFLVIRKYADHPKLFEPEQLRLPPGAGLVVRKQAWLACMPESFTRAHRGGHDYEISLHLYKAGWEIWFNPAMQIEHCIPAWRMEKDYLVRIARIYGLCTCEIRLIIAAPWQKPLILVKGFLGSSRRLARHWLKHRGKIGTGLAAACETAFLWGSVLSPFHYLQKRLLHFVAK